LWKGGNKPKGQQCPGVQGVGGWVVRSISRDREALENSGKAHRQIKEEVVLQVPRGTGGFVKTKSKKKRWGTHDLKAFRGRDSVSASPAKGKD